MATKRLGSPAKGIGRPEGTKNPTAVEKIRKQRENILEAALRRALAGDGEAARFCFEVAEISPFVETKPLPRL